MVLLLSFVWILRLRFAALRMTGINKSPARVTRRACEWFYVRSKKQQTSMMLPKNSSRIGRNTRSAAIRNAQKSPF